MGFINIFEIDFLDNPPRETIQEAIDELLLYQAIDAKGEITEIGHKVRHFPYPFSIIMFSLLNIWISDGRISIGTEFSQNGNHFWKAGLLRRNFNYCCYVISW